MAVVEPSFVGTLINNFDEVAISLKDNPLGLVALVVLVMAALSYAQFGRMPRKFQPYIHVITLLSLAIFAYAVIVAVNKVQRQEITSEIGGWAYYESPKQGFSQTDDGQLIALNQSRARYEQIRLNDDFRARSDVFLRVEPHRDARDIGTIGRDHCARAMNANNPVRPPFRDPKVETAGWLRMVQIQCRGA